MEDGGGDGAGVAAEGGPAIGDADGEDVVIGAGRKFGGGAGDSVAGVELGGADDVSVDVAATVDGKAIEGDVDDVGGAGGGVDLAGNAAGDAVVVPGISGGDSGGMGVTGV